MKKWLYVLAPTAMLAVFLYFYFDSRAETEAKEKAHQEEVAKAKAEADEKKHIAEVKAREDAERRNTEREAEDAKTTKEKEEKYLSEMRRIQDDTDKANTLAETYSKEVSELTVQLDTLHKQKDSLTREGFELDKKIELAEVARRNAEMEIQRTVEIISTRTEQSPMSKMPPPPPAKES
jgi:multidrug efflux pump subunit AcrA (membrane-fusion protein)